MSKRVKVTKELEATIRKALGDPEADVNNFAIYEARFITTEPLKKGGIFNGGRLSAQTLQEMATFLNKEGGALPLHIMHNTRTLPIGRVFNSKVMNMSNGEVELRGQFMVPLDKTEIVSDIDNSVIDEVSIGVMTKHAFCSECGFDYMGEDADIMNFVELTCDKGHKIGVDGVHVRLVGLQDWMELSLVGQGAGKGVKILPRAKQSMSKEMVERLAASNKPADACILTASTKMGDSSTSNSNGDAKMEVKEIMAELKASASELGEKKAELLQATKSIETLNGEIAALKASVSEKDAKIKELEAGQTAPVAELQTKLSKAEEDMKAVNAKLAEHVKAALVASGTTENDLPTDALATLKLVEEKGLKLHQVIGVGAKAGETKLSASAGQTAAEIARKNSFKLSN